MCVCVCKEWGSFFDRLADKITTLTSLRTTSHGVTYIIYTYRMGFETSWILPYSNRYLWENNLINLRMHKTSSHFLQRFDPEGSSSGNTRLETRFTKKTFVKCVFVFQRLIRLFSHKYLRVWSGSTLPNLFEP